VKYGPRGELADYHLPRLSPGLEYVVASKNLSLDAALKLDKEKRPKVQSGGVLVFHDVQVLSDDNILCLTGDNSLVWYDGAGKALRELNLAEYMFQHRSTGTPPGIVRRFALSPDDRYLFGIEWNSDRIYKVDLRHW
jgi:hypothetical protein